MGKHRGETRGKGGKKRSDKRGMTRKWEGREGRGETLKETADKKWMHKYNPHMHTTSHSPGRNQMHNSRRDKHMVDGN
jgi:hypothetical protein